MDNNFRRGKQSEFQSQGRPNEEARADPVIDPLGSGSGSGSFAAMQQHGVVRNQICETSRSSIPNRSNVCTAQPSQAPNITVQAPNTSDAFVSERRRSGLSEAEKKERKREIDRAYRQKNKKLKEYLEKENQSLKNNFEDQVEEILGFKNELLKLKEEMESTMVSLKGENESLKKDNILINETLEEQARNIEGLRNDNSQLKNEFSKSKEEMESTMVSLAGENESLKKENESFKNVNALMNQTLKVQERKIRGLRNDNSQLRDELLKFKRKTESTVGMLKGENDSFRKSKENFERKWKRIHELSDCNSYRRDELAKLNEKVDSTMEVLKSENEHLKSWNAYFISTDAWMKHTLTVQENKIRGLTDDNSELRHELQKIKEDMQSNIPEPGGKNESSENEYSKEDNTNESEHGNSANEYSEEDTNEYSEEDNTTECEDSE